MKLIYTTLSKHFALLFIILVIPLSAIAQVGINTTTPADGSILDIASGDKGVLFPRMDISDLGNIAPITGGAPDGLVVYNTNTSTGPGLFAWNTTVGQWLSVDGDKNWRKGGNGNTSPGTGLGDDYIGTNDAQHLEIGTDGTSRARFEDNGQISMGFGSGFVNTGQQFNVLGTGLDWTAIGGYSGDAGTGVYGQNISNGYGIRGLNSANGIGVIGENTNLGPGIYGVNYSTGVAIYGESFSGAPSVYGLDGPIQADQTTFGGNAFVGLANDDFAFGSYLNNANNIGTSLFSFAGSLGIYLTTGSGVASSAPNTGIFAYAGNGDALVANELNSAGYYLLDTDSDLSTNDFRATATIAGYADVDPDGAGGAVSQPSYFGGYFSGGLQDGTETFTYVGMRHNTSLDGSSGTDYKVVGTGAVSTIIVDSNNNPRIMFAPEAPEILFQDFGIGQLSNGSATIHLDPVLSKAIHVDASHALRVYVTLEGDCNGIYVTNKSQNGFTVKELNGGTSNVQFSWQIVANRANRTDASGRVVSNHIDQRLPFGPGPLKQKELSTPKSKPLPYAVERSVPLENSTTPYSKEKVSEIAKKIEVTASKKRDQQ